MEPPNSMNALLLSLPVKKSEDCEEEDPQR